MKVTFRHGMVELEIDGIEDPEEAWSKLGEWQHVFWCASMCGKCKSTRTYLSRRAWDKGDRHYTFFSAVCYDCTAKLDFWPPRDGRGFEPKLKAEDGGLLRDGGWIVYEKRSWQRPHSENHSYREIDTPVKVTTSRRPVKHADNVDMHADGSNLTEAEISF